MEPARFCGSVVAIMIRVKEIPVTVDLLPASIRPDITWIKVKGLVIDLLKTGSSLAVVVKVVPVFAIWRLKPALVEGLTILVKISATFLRILIPTVLGPTVICSGRHSDRWCLLGTLLCACYCLNGVYCLLIFRLSLLQYNPCGRWIGRLIIIYVGMGINP